MARQPNVVLIICDDLALGDLYCYGNEHSRTPHLDRLHSESVRLARYYSGPMCSPTRASLMTGRDNYRTGVVDTSAGRAMMYPDEITVAELLKSSGYATGIFGKWHLGDNYPMRAMDQGFSESVVHNSGNIGKTANPPGNGYFDPILLHNGAYQKYHGYCTDIFASEAISFIEAQRDQPFFVYLSFNCPHSPFEIGEEWVAPYREAGLPEKFARIYGMVENIDVNVGRVVQTLDQQNLARDTILIFTSDHGPCPSARHDGKDRFNCGLRGRKGTVYEGGIRVPFLLRYPARAAGGRDVDHIAQTIDVLPTLAAWCGAQAPTDRRIDGIDLTPLLEGAETADPWPERRLFVQLDRMEDVPRRYHNAAVIGRRYKLCTTPDGAACELYDLENDPYETQDVAQGNSEIVEALKAEYDRWFDSVSSERGFVPPRIILGADEHNPSTLSRQDWLGPERVHMTDEEVGYWEVRFARDGEYELTVTFPPAHHPSVLEVALGNVRRTTEVRPGMDTYTFTNLRLTVGDARIDARLTGGGAHRGAREIVVTRV